jgi:hypothetical protein
MKSTDRFKETIKAYLDMRADRDSLFARVYSKPSKNINDCINYILSTVQKSKINGYTDQEIYSMAIHYYDENDIKISASASIKDVVINHQVNLTEEEIAEAKAQAKKRIEDEAYAKLKKKPEKTTKEEVGPAKSLF